jgi:phage repressor protein C with HTH and peptisase S24 domain/DNA-binding Xre family transcriptional regulator
MIGSTLKDLLGKRGMTVPQLSRATGVSAQTLYSIIKRDSMKIDFDVLLKLCQALDVPVESFYGAGAPTQLPSSDEWSLIGKYRRLDDHGKKLTNAVIDTELERLSQSEAEEEDTSRIIPLYYTPAAAGYASPALGEDYEDYSVSAASRADFAVRIQGDSMEPWIADGEIVLVRRGGVQVGDVGMFFVDGDMKCKQYCRDNYGNTYLFSLNRKRADADTFISPDSGITLCCFGRVLLSRRPPLPII